MKNIKVGYHFTVRYDFKNYEVVTTIINRTEHRRLFSTYWMDRGIKLSYRYYVANELFNDPSMSVFDIMKFVCEVSLEQMIKLKNDN